MDKIIKLAIWIENKKDELTQFTISERSFGQLDALNMVSHKLKEIIDEIRRD